MITLTDIDKSLLAFHEWCVDSFGDEFIPSIDMIKAWQAAYLRSQDKIIELEHTIAMSEPLGWFHIDYPAERYGNLDEIEYDFGSTEGARPLFTSPQPNQSEYIKRLEDALKDIRRDTAGLYQEGDSKSLMNRLIDVREQAEKALASKESIDG